MVSSTPRCQLYAAPRWRVLLCVLLAGLFLYNPFFAVSASAGGLNVRHPASHRAAVGSSELQHFTAVDGQDMFAVADADAAEAFAQAVLTLQAVAPSFDDAHVSQQFLCASLWFRPPPTL
jgi:hypothetical protein